MINGFKKVGHYLFDASAVDYTKCVKDQLRKTLSATVVPSPPVLTSDEASILSNHLNFIEERIGDEVDVIQFCIWWRMAWKCRR